MGCVGSLLRLALFEVLVDVFLGGRVGCWDSGRGVCFVEVCFGSGISILGLHTIYMTNVTSLIFLGRRRVVNETWLMWEFSYIRSLMLIDNTIAKNKQCMSAPRVLCSYFLMGG